MNEIQRQQYLEALGVDSYMPRWILPVAPAPVSCAPVLPVTGPSGNQQAAPAVSPVAQSGQIEAAAGSVAAVRETMAGNNETVSNDHAVEEVRATPSALAADTLSGIADVVKSSSVTPRPLSEISAGQSSRAQSSPAQPTTTDIDPRFSLSLWRASDDLIVVDSRHAELALPTEPLLANILLALGLPRQSLSKAEVLRWPMVDHRLAPKGEAAARETVLAMLEGKLEAQPARYVLLMGAEACHFVLPSELLPESGGLSADESYRVMQGKTHSIESLGATAIVVPSLCEMLQHPELKAITWRSIQPLRQS